MVKAARKIGPLFLGSVGFAGYGKTHQGRHSEERSDEESLFLWSLDKEGFLSRKAGSE
jgi:hypothetical protein